MSHQTNFNILEQWQWGKYFAWCLWPSGAYDKMDHVGCYLLWNVVMLILTSLIMTKDKSITPQRPVTHITSHVPKYRFNPPPLGCSLASYLVSSVSDMVSARVLHVYFANVERWSRGARVTAHWRLIWRLNIERTVPLQPLYSCTHCHCTHHPLLNRWIQDNSWQLSSYFSLVSLEESWRLKTKMNCSLWSKNFQFPMIVFS